MVAEGVEGAGEFEAEPGPDPPRRDDEVVGPGGIARVDIDWGRGLRGRRERPGDGADRLLSIGEFSLACDMQGRRVLAGGFVEGRYLDVGALPRAESGFTLGPPSLCHQGVCAIKAEAALRTKAISLNLLPGSGGTISPPKVRRSIFSQGMHRLQFPVLGAASFSGAGTAA